MAETARTDAAAPHATDRWVGASVLVGGKGYAPTPMGQVHYRDLGPRDTSVPILLLHMTPLSMVQYARAQTTIAANGIRAIALDTPGYGMSDPPPAASPRIADFADNLVAVLDHLGVERVVVAGHHTGACIASSFAARHPQRVAGLILHGVPMFNEEEIALRLNRPLGDRTPQPDGSHLTHCFDPGFMGPHAKSPGYFEALTWFAVSVMMQGPDLGHLAVYRYDMRADLLALETPVLIASDLGDAVHPVDLRARALRPDFAYREFSADGTMSIMMHPHEWAAMALAWQREIVRKAPVVA
jgi:pimeloyl-ACP methyl ester carboxylesterase